MSLDDIEGRVVIIRNHEFVELEHDHQRLVDSLSGRERSKAKKAGIKLPRGKMRAYRECDYTKG